MEMKLLSIAVYLIVHFAGDVDAARRLAHTATYNVKSYGAKGDGRTDDSQAFAATWTAACASAGDITYRVPRGTYLVGPVTIRGPCSNVQSMRIEIRGTLKAVTDLNKYPSDEWFEFARVDNLTLTGGGTFDGQGAVSWPRNNCPKNKDCKVLPTSIKFMGLTNAVVEDITSVNSKFFHLALLSCSNFRVTNIKISAPETSPNTDGIHLERNTGVSITNADIGTGDDCVSIGQGNSDITLTDITCGPGHGISVGSLGRYKDEEDVRGLIVKDSTLTNTQNGVRIKTWQNSPKVTKAANMTFDNIVMTQVGNPIIIDQTYCPYANCANQPASRVKISDINFNNIRGTSTTPQAVTLKCSSGLPCQKITLHDVNIKYIGGADTTSSCVHAHAEFSGTQIPPPC